MKGESCLGSNGIFEHLNWHLKSPTTKLLVMVGGKLPPSLIPVLEFTVTCSHYHCTWYKSPAPGRLGKSFHPSYKLQRHAAFPHNTFFEHWSPFSSLPTQCLIHSVLSAKGQNLKIISLGPMDVFHLYLHYYICSQALNLFKSMHATGLVQALWEAVRAQTSEGFRFWLCPFLNVTLRKWPLPELLQWKKWE